MSRSDNTHPLDLGKRLELLLDDYLLQESVGGARQRLHQPRPCETVLEHSSAWEGSTCGYQTIFQDGPLYRMYYRGSQPGTGEEKRFHPDVTCYAESRDGINWHKPTLGKVTYQGSSTNNIIWTLKGSHNFCPFKDPNPDASPEARYKAVGGGMGIGGLYAFQSADGLSWEFACQDPIITKGKFDSQNLVFWDSLSGQYRAYYRDIIDKFRYIKTSTSNDFLNWNEGEFLEYPGAPDEELYTNQVMPYYRAPHIYIGFPARYLRNRGHAVEGLFMSSRDGVTFNRSKEALLPPGQIATRWGNRANYIWWALVETASPFPGAPNELSIYSNERGVFSTSVRRFAFRIDGFASIYAPLSGGEIITRPLTCSGETLLLNLATSVAGSVRVEVQDAEGNPIEGYTLEDSEVFYGDAIAHRFQWGENGASLADLLGRSIRLRIVLQDADIFSLRFADWETEQASTK